ncbi:MAG: UDP-glucose 4-epimerase GalE [Candidatus Levyibacteriota bacterium]|nr:MAG: UDP-glucose 4-epimerase GalE [Candidatus Levybacteria bacterium]
MKILVTGGAGYIGSFAVNGLLDKGYEVVILDSFERGHKETVDKRAEVIKLDILDKSLSEVFSKYNFDGVMHFAGYISMEESMQNPGLYFYKNTTASQLLIEQVVKHQVKHFIFSSTAGVYGNPIKVPIPEDHPQHPTNPYGESKLMVEKILSWYQKIYGLSFVSLRYFNAAGASLDGSFGEDHSPETHIIPLAIKAAIDNKEFVLYGTDYNTKDGSCIRDYIHVVDLVEAHLLALEKLQKENGGYFYNVGAGNGYSNKEVIEMVKKVSGIDFLVKEAQRRPGDAQTLIADPTNIKKELGFSPKYSDLQTIIESVWQWHKNKKGN